MVANKAAWGVRLSERVVATADLDALARSAAILVATPAQATRDAAARLATLPDRRRSSPALRA